MSEQKDIGYMAQFSATLSQDGVNLSINFNMPESATPADFSAKLDMLRGVVARQRARGEVPLLEAMIAEKQAALRNQELDLAQYSKRPSARPDDETTARTRARIDEMTADIERGNVHLEATRKLAE